jgi:hypothetical protein
MIRPIIKSKQDVRKTTTTQNWKLKKSSNPTDELLKLFGTLTKNSQQIKKNE